MTSYNGGSPAAHPERQVVSPQPLPDNPSPDYPVQALAAVLGGVTVTGGNADGPDEPNTMPHLARGGGIWNATGSPTVSDCIIEYNAVLIRGGGMYNRDSNPTLTNCTFTVNQTLAGRGAAMYNESSSTTLTSCRFSNNWATDGGGIYNEASDPIVTNCTFTLNQAGFEDGDGGGMYNQDSSPTIINCILWNNGQNEIFDDADSVTTARYSDIEQGWPGTGNIDTDPMFIDPKNGDYRLSSGSPAIDAGNNWGVPIDSLDFDVDGLLCELFPVDLDGNPRFNADEADFDPGCGVPVVVDMGAYEYQFDPVENVIFADLNIDGAVGVKDLLILLGNWGLCGKGCCLADLDINGNVGVTDLLVLLGNWGPCP